MLPKTKHNLLKFHHCLFAALIWTVIFCVIQSYEGNFVVAIQKTYQNSGAYPPLSLITCDYNIPIISWFNAFYLTAVPTWTIVPIVLFLVYGPKRFGKLISIEILVYSICFVISIILPVSSEPVQQYAKQQMVNQFGFWNDIEKWMLNTNFPLLSFPSNHCTNEILLMFAIIDFNFFNKTNKKDSKKILIWKWIFTSLFSCYAVMVCVSTFVLKAHFFVDWIPSVIICIVCWIAMRFVKNDKVANWFNKLFINFGWMMGYYDTQNRFGSGEELTWGRIYKDDKKPLGGGARFYILADIVVAIIYGTIVAFMNLNIVSVGAKSVAYSFIQPAILMLILVIYAGCLARHAVCQKRKNFYETTYSI